MKNLIQKGVLVFAFLCLTAFGIQADSTFTDVLGDPFVLGKGGASMRLTDSSNTSATIVGKLGDRFVAFANNDNAPALLKGKLFLVDNVNVGHSTEGGEKIDRTGTCTWDGDKSSVIDIDGVSLYDMRYKFNDWPQTYMQIFWVDMSEKVGDKPNVFAISNSCNSDICHVFKYDEEYDENANVVTKRTLTKVSELKYSHILQGIDIIDMNPMRPDTKEGDDRCPPILVTMEKSYDESNGPNHSFWCVSSFLAFKNLVFDNNNKIEMKNFGAYTCEYAPLQDFDIMKMWKIMFNKSKDTGKDQKKYWEGICGGGVTALGKYKDVDTPTLTYYTMKTEGKLSSSNVRSKPLAYSWGSHAVGHKFTYNKESRLFADVESQNFKWEGGSVAGDPKKDNKIKESVKDSYHTCHSNFFFCRGPKIVMDHKEGSRDYDLYLPTKELIGERVRGGARHMFTDSTDKKSVGTLKTSEFEKGELVEQDQYKEKDEGKGEALRKCDQAGKQVVAVFLGVPISPSKQPKIQATSPHTSMSINYQQVKSNGFFTDKGVDASWDISSGYFWKVYRF